MTISSGLRGNPNPDSQANGAMMRISPLGIFGVRFELDQLAERAMQDAALTHPNKICQQANALFTMGISHAIQSGCDRKELYQSIRQWAVDMTVDSALMETIEKAASKPPADYVHRQGWVLIAFQNALYQLLHAPSLEAGVVDTVMGGGDTDSNAAICGALLGAVWGAERHSRPMARLPAKLPSRSRKPKGPTPTPGMLLASGCFGTGRGFGGRHLKTEVELGNCNLVTG